MRELDVCRSEINSDRPPSSYSEPLPLQTTVTSNFTEDIEDLRKLLADQSVELEDLKGE